MEKKQTEEAETSRFHNRLYRAEISRTPAGSQILMLVPNNLSGPFGRPRRIAEHLYEIAAEMQRRSEDLGARWLIAVEHVAASLKRFGWRQPIVCKRSREIVAGNTRYKAARSLSMEKVPVVWFDGSDLEAVAYSIADNRTHEFATWIEEDLASLLEHLREEDALEGVGFSSDEIDELLRQVRDDPTVTINGPGRRRSGGCPRAAATRACRKPEPSSYGCSAERSTA